MTKGAKISTGCLTRSGGALPSVLGWGLGMLADGLEPAYLVGSGCALLAARVSWVSRVSRAAIRCMDKGCRG